MFLLTANGVGAASSSQSSAGSSASAQPWWGGQFAYRQSLTITNPTVLLSLQSQPVGPGGFTFQLSAPTGRTYVVLASSDLMHWTPICTNAATIGWTVFTDPQATNFARRFYRARVQ